MKLTTILMIPCIITTTFIKAQNNLPVIKSGINRASIRINDEKNARGWGINATVKPDIFDVPCSSPKTKATFITDTDSITYIVEIGKSYPFVVLLNGKDSAFTVLRGIKNIEPAVFSKKYIKQNRGKWSVEVKEAQELLQVIFAITPTGLGDTKSMILNNDPSKYYAEVMAHFLPFKNEPVVAAMDSMLQIGRYIRGKAEACVYLFKGNHLKKNGVYDRFIGQSNVLDRHIPAMEDFAIKSGFRKFYNEHKKIYDSLIQWQKKAVPLKQQWDWCEQQFPSRYDSYKIYFSPLVKGNHNTVNYFNNGFGETNMFIRPPYIIEGVNEAVQEGLLTRFVFTEIDHNYVNPVTDNYLKEVNSIFNDRAKWAAGKESNGYQDPYNLFNEYMTWSVYLVYCYDNYTAADFKIINERIVDYVINRRGFPKFDVFTEQLLQLYKNRAKGVTIADLYPAFLEWCKTI